MEAFKRCTLVAVLVALSAVLIIPSGSASQISAASISTLVEVRAAHHPGYDRIVFEFDGPIPAVTKAFWASDLRLQPSNRRAHVQGEAFIKVRFRTAVAHELDPPQDSTFGPARRAYALPNIAHVVLLEDNEGDVAFGIGLMKRTRILKKFKLREPNRFVVDVATDFGRGKVKVFFVDDQAVVEGDEPFVELVMRKVPRGRRAEAALQRLYAGPTEAELENGLLFIDSNTNGFRDLRVNDRGIARVTLRGNCNSGGSALVTVASEIQPTLKSRPSIKTVKIYDRHGDTLRPWGPRDSIPACLEP